MQKKILVLMLLPPQETLNYILLLKITLISALLLQGALYLGQVFVQQKG
jgi:hypothetical protein